MTGERRTISVEERIQSWIALGADPAEACWHAALAAALDTWREHLIGGRIVTSSAPALDEGQSFETLCLELDLPPDVAGVFLPPALSVHFEPPPQAPALRRAPGDISQLVLLGSDDWPQRLMIAELAPQADAPGVDVFEKGRRIADEAFSGDVAAGLTAMAWRHLAPKADVPQSACARYTEWWFRRCAAAGRVDLGLHPELSYLHHPERFGMDTVEALFRLAEAVLPEVCETVRDEAPSTPDGAASMAEAVQLRLLGLFDLLRRGGIVDFAALRGDAELRFKDGFNRTVEHTCRLLEPSAGH